ncbi:thiamine ABC transporter ATP-binding protein [Erwinia sp. OLTSP20]|uniref:thiamine ABC transporter ATP-binding protein ThiQ n=1 Tax=unclassified Erwinia TaxID=2622719 RepID=UPI000C192C17|nr:MULTISPECIES: thiamine ABC transporter ATP-binding protein ThiQ [unclassified Erwinia]PIJ49732.1 thiamine ABC transporter ATP-binding protein [Erwinia sp. OAMSP11]PIJ70830.1 thiamine ABC transporter ATP-binding protein [Erwinia sp. OLSSP12]PIJ80196.1 thiamine ABC transporter ATP-binding protein [Erwinia sp. OLCASP19]PIJ82319.1 thiamine ABC transporter ATP-binding protein [Erwinia sp. OLMTSP26]PIJ85006.1 thiamine ABC transporter ATP-binding protein [Erwinia sp. OLMDSP33]
MLTLTDLTYLYHHLPMRFSFHLAAGERVAILGPSGAGKSTLLSLIAGFLTVSQGQLQLNGQRHTHTPPAQRPVSMLFQEHNLFPHLSVAENIGLGLHPGLKLTPAQKQTVTDIAGQIGMAGLLDRLPGQLSGGQRQRAALARCLVRQQPILLLDEPFSALDPALRQEMLQLVETVCQQRDITLLMVSHNIDDALRIAPRSLLVADGRIAWDGASEQLLRTDSDAARVLGISRR